MSENKLSTKKYILIALVAIIAFAIMIVSLFLVFKLISNKNTSKNKSILDKDTGETVNINGAEKEKSINNSGIAIIGMDSLAHTNDIALNAKQIAALRKDITTKAANSLPGHGEVFKIANTNTKDGKIEADLIYRDNGEKVKIYISLDASNEFIYELNKNDVSIYRSSIF
jgi:hypothetical protein